MKKYYYMSVLSLMISGSALAQKKENCEPDTNKMEFTNYDILVVEKRNCDTIAKVSEKPRVSSGKFSNWSGFYLGVNGLMTPNNDFDLGAANPHLELDYSKCMTLGLNFAEIKIKIVPHYVGLTTGMGIQWNRYGFKNGYTLGYTKDTLFGYLDSSVSYTKNRLNVTSLQIPLLLEFKTHRKNSKAFHFWVGGIASYKLGAKLKQDFTMEYPFTENQHDIEVRSKGHYHLNPLIFYGTFAIGYGKHFQLFANYGLSELFSKGKAPAAVPFTIGLKLL